MSVVERLQILEKLEYYGQISAAKTGAQLQLEEPPVVKGGRTDVTEQVIPTGENRESGNKE